MGGTENIKYYQNYQVNLLNHVTRLNLPVIGKSNLSAHSQPPVHSQPSVHMRSFSSQEISNASYFAVLERQNTDEHTNCLVDQVKESAKEN